MFQRNTCHYQCLLARTSIVNATGYYFTILCETFSSRFDLIDVNHLKSLQEIEGIVADAAFDTGV
jgi:hypothetical protein